MTSLQDLLPGAEDSVRCAEHSRNLAIDPGGTAIRADRVVLIETPLPWPKPVFDHPALVEMASILREHPAIPTRTLAFVPAAAAGAAGGTSVISFDRVPETSTVLERRFSPQSAEERVELARRLASDDRNGLDELADERSELSTPVLLVCTQGSHDVCCGSEGARFASEAETIGDLRVFRVSHTGGHRFAPTAMTLPDGRMWADMDLDLLRRIVSRTGETADVSDRCRGWWGAEPGPAQMAERAVFERVGWDVDKRERTVEEGGNFDGALQFAVASGGDVWEVTVAVGRVVPTIACRQLGGLPAKESLEYQVQDIRGRLFGDSAPA